MSKGGEGWEEERAQLVEELAAARAQIARSTTALDELAHAVSHDVRAPLRAIATFSSWLERDLADHLTGDRAEWMRLLRSRTEHLEKLLEGMLQFARADRKRDAVEEVDTEDLVRGIAPNAVCTNLPTLRTERAALQRVFSVLLDNAERYGGEGNIRVSARERRGQYEFAVADEGPGIPARLQDRIWLLFQSAQPPGTEGSTGTGLPIAKKVVERRGGTIWVDAEITKGATFRFTWPTEPHP